MKGSITERVNKLLSSGFRKKRIPQKLRSLSLGLSHRLRFLSPHFRLVQCKMSTSELANGEKKTQIKCNSSWLCPNHEWGRGTVSTSGSLSVTECRWVAHV